jgi:protein-S-isoprenylcysteine O-methyltransferase Ste14
MKRNLLAQMGMIVNGLSIALFFFLANVLEVPDVPPPLRYLAWVLFGLGILLILLSIVSLMSNKDSSLIDWGVYRLVRHPMYLGAILLFLSWIGFLPHWIVILVSIINTLIVYWFMLEGERQNIANFGDPYRNYMNNVPRLNLLAGIFRALQGK